MARTGLSLPLPETGGEVPLLPLRRVPGHKPEVVSGPLPMVDERLSSDERAELFFVGDKKQAIYRWREGRAHGEGGTGANLPALRNREGGEGSLQTKTLGKNWRSGERIVEFNNSFWGLTGPAGRSSQLSRVPQPWRKLSRSPAGDGERATEGKGLRFHRDEDGGEGREESGR